VQSLFVEIREILSFHILFSIDDIVIAHSYEKTSEPALKEPLKNDDDTPSQSPSNPNRTTKTAIAEDVLFAKKKPRS
jgi:hypothetical protein